MEIMTVDERAAVRNRVLSQRRLGESLWRKAVQRLSPITPSPESSLLCAVIAHVIVSAEIAAVANGDAPLQRVPSWLRSRSCGFYCRALGINQDALMDMVRRAGEAYAEVETIRWAAPRNTAA